ncbi:MAG: hypothetical protein A2074_08280 [Candidatus Aquicultor primus]|uniref:Uncharacterized protein n=1 Tax=Candidatus Aquicultor primus TaxID=1797195 RepID=A0A1F2UG35_9ACTN|nr:MAG: hypothetical protein A2074_08280 [Candidatus Aquicultor primus]
MNKADKYSSRIAEIFIQRKSGEFNRYLELRGKIDCAYPQYQDFAANATYGILLPLYRRVRLDRPPDMLQNELAAKISTLTPIFALIE